MLSLDIRERNMEGYTADEKRIYGQILTERNRQLKNSNVHVSPLRIVVNNLPYNIFSKYNNITTMTACRNYGTRIKEILFAKRKAIRKRTENKTGISSAFVCFLF